MREMRNKLKGWDKWTDYSKNPIIKPRLPDLVIADPSFIHKKESPDGKWHLFAHGVTSGINHFVSDDGLKWEKLNQKIDIGCRPYIYKENNTYYLLYEKFKNFLNILRSFIVVRKSFDLINWSKPKTILTPTLNWEKGMFQRVGNPCLVKYDNKYRLYYSANSVFIKEYLFNEPKYIGIAESNNIEGPYKKLPYPIITPSKNHKYRNTATGAIKVIKANDLWIGFNNGIYKDKNGRTRSSILLLYSTDGINWKDAFKEPIISPSSGWKRSSVYQLDVRPVGNSFWLYYNARDGGVIGTERIGLTFLNKKSLANLVDDDSSEDCESKSKLEELITN